ncbi:ABC transporter substrate-binding protein [Kribbella sp. NPDC051137]|uniref:ABC transporter substrate-binding protein n=1 Tax=Kribbella sp. NPDC051137 TaxID=3155045 RepID=UPI002F7DA5DB
MRTRTAVVAATASAVALAITGCANNAQGGSTQAVAGSTSSVSGDKVTIMVGGLDKQIYLPFMLAKQLGYYDKVGVNVALVGEGAGVDATTEMMAGKVQGTGGFYDHTIALQAQGKNAEAVVSMLQVPGEVELCRSDLQGTVHSPKDWKGRHLGITDVGSSTDFLTQYLGTQNGIDPSQTTRIGVQAGNTFIAAMQHKQIDCGMTTEPTVSKLLQDKTAYILEDMRTAAGATKSLGGTYPATSLYMQTSWVQSHKDVVQKLVTAYVATLKWIQTHTAAQIADQMPADYYAGVGKAAYTAALDSEKGIFNPTGIMPADGPKTCLAVLGAFNPKVKGKSIDLTKTYTNEFVQAAQPLS